MPAIPILYALYILFTRSGKSLRRVIANPETRGLAYLTLSLLLVGMVFYRIVEGWSWLDSLYFSVITLTTVGYGDFSPQTSLGKIFTIGYILTGLGVIASFITVLATHQSDDPSLIERFTHVTNTNTASSEELGEDTP